MSEEATVAIEAPAKKVTKKKVNRYTLNDCELEIARLDALGTLNSNHGILVQKRATQLRREQMESWNLKECLEELKRLEKFNLASGEYYETLKATAKSLS